MTRKKLACVASVSARIRRGKLGREQKKKKKKGRRGRGGRGDTLARKPHDFEKHIWFVVADYKCFGLKKKCTFFLSVNVFSTKVLIGDTVFTSPNGDGTAILRGHPSRAKVSPLAVQRKYLHFSVIIRPWVMVRPRESNSRPPALQSNALPTELVLPRLLTDLNCVCAKVYEIRVFKV